MTISSDDRSAAGPPSPAGDAGASDGRPSSIRSRGALAGLAAGFVGLGITELLAGLVAGVPSLVVAVGSLVIALQPPGAKDLVATVFGTNDKLALNAAVVVVGLAVSALAGLLAVRSFARGVLVFVAFGLLGFWAASMESEISTALALVGALVGVGSAVATLWLLLRVGQVVPPRPAVSAPGAPAAAEPAESEPAASLPAWDRRRFLLTTGGIIAAAAAAGFVGRRLLDAEHPSAAPAAATLPVPLEPASALTADQSLEVPGITPIVVPNDAFYRIDTALLVPQVDVANWKVAVTGMVERPMSFTYDELRTLPQFEQYVTIACVSNQVGGHLVGNTRWSGVHLKPLLAMAGIKAGATQIVGRSVDGFTVGFPTEWALDPAREPMIALGMNGAPLPAEHGYPARLIVPGLYGYVSATKWLSEIELTTREAFDAYWIPLGWAKDGPILTQSRIDSPADGRDISAGPTWIDGVAWAPDRGIEKVEVRIDQGPWQPAMLSRAISKATWVQWALRWSATPGSHTIEVRATDGTGTTQTADRTDPAPSGARGHHTIHVDVH